MLLISDACILIDIINSNLISAMFSLPYQFAVPDILFAEELVERHSDLLAFGLICQSMRSELIEETYLLRQQQPRLSTNDLLTLVLAKDQNSPLLTGDKALRNLALNFGIEVHGTIWLIKQLLQYEKINIETAQIAFQKMKDSGSRLPWNKIEIMLAANILELEVT